MYQSYKGRAKQFLPYASLRGFDEIVEAKRHIKSPRRELLDDAAEELSFKLSSLTVGKECIVTYYQTDAYITKQAAFIRIDTTFKTVYFEGFSVPIADIFSIELL